MEEILCYQIARSAPIEHTFKWRKTIVAKFQESPRIRLNLHSNLSNYDRPPRSGIQSTKFQNIDIHR